MSLSKREEMKGRNDRSEDHAVVSIPRDGTNIWNFDWWKVPGAIFTGVGAGSAALYNLLQTPGKEDPTTTTTPNGGTVPGRAPPGPLLSNPNQELDLGQPSGKFIRPPTGDLVPSVAPPQCDTANIFSNGCGKVLDQLIFTTGCSTIVEGQVPTASAIAQNAAILDELQRVATGPVLTTTSDHCGAFMFVASITRKDSERIKGMPCVSDVSDDVYFSESMNHPQSQPGLLEPAFKRRQFRKRGLVMQSFSPDHLQFLSMYKNSPTTLTEYVYDSTGGVDTEVFYIRPGVAINHLEFASNPITLDDFIFANDIHSDDTLEEGSDGTCVASLVRGIFFGVSKRTRLRPVRVDTKISSVMSGMVGILNYVKNRVENPGPEGTGNGFDLLGTMVWNYGIVTVVPAGKGYYPAEYAKTHPVISVGAVDPSGARFPWSPGLDEVTVTAPGEARCASNNGGEGTITSMLPAAAQAAGLAAYFLTLFPDLRANRKEAPLRVKNWMVRKSWPRLEGGLPSIWNMRGTNTPDPYGDEIPLNLPY
ncbi:hypothetical protein MMC22_011591 [Lobaria immixta]|nr:hypothetical protein [Lobaria immixta]